MNRMRFLIRRMILLGKHPMWKPEPRRAAGSKQPRYPSDLTDAEWELVAPMIPPEGADMGPRSNKGRDGVC